MQVMKAGITASQRRRRGDNGLTLAMDPKTRRLLRYEEVHHCTHGLLARQLPAIYRAVAPWHITGLCKHLSSLHFRPPILQTSSFFLVSNKEVSLSSIPLTACR